MKRILYLTVVLLTLFSCTPEENAKNVKFMRLDLSQTEPTFRIAEVYTLEDAELHYAAEEGAGKISDYDGGFIVSEEADGVLITNKKTIQAYTIVKGGDNQSIIRVSNSSVLVTETTNGVIHISFYLN